MWREGEITGGRLLREMRRPTWLRRLKSERARERERERERAHSTVAQSHSPEPQSRLQGPEPRARARTLHTAHTLDYLILIDPPSLRGPPWLLIDREDRVSGGGCTVRTVPLHLYFLP
jgi:hypothetical protein